MTFPEGLKCPYTDPSPLPVLCLNPDSAGPYKAARALAPPTITLCRTRIGPWAKLVALVRGESAAEEGVAT